MIKEIQWMIMVFIGNDFCLWLKSVVPGLVIICVITWSSLLQSDTMQCQWSVQSTSLQTRDLNIFSAPDKLAHYIIIFMLQTFALDHG